MLKPLLNPSIVPKAGSSHEDLFMQRYERLLTAARRLTGDAGRAEDLVHNAFVQFMLLRPSLASIQDLDGYLLVMLRNMNISQVRRAAIIQTDPLSAADYDSAEAGLRALDAHAQLQIREQLCLICEYACRRKERSGIGSALILRFFHGYYPSEVAQVSRSSRHVVEQWLLLARQEARAYVENPGSLKLIEGGSEPVVPNHKIGGSTAEFMHELRKSIFLARSGQCFTDAELQEVCRTNEPGARGHSYLSHIVSCARCLDEVNSLLGLPSLAERFPMETFGHDPRPRGGRGPGDDGGTGMSGGTEIDKLKQVSRRRMVDVLEHRPKELRIAVNGYVLGSQSVCAESNKLALRVDLAEHLGFVEVFSEQGICLMFSSVGAPPDGALEQGAHAEFSEGRTLDLNLNFTGPWPTVNVVYLDPTLGLDEVAPTELDAIQEPAALSQSSTLEDEFLARLSTKPSSLGLAKLRQTFADWRFWLRPGTVTALVAVLCIAALLFVKLNRSPLTPITASDLLRRAVSAEKTFAARTDLVVHRTISLEERRVGPASGSSIGGQSKNGELIARRKIDVWQSAERGVTARRLYDESNALIAGDWRRADGVQTIYHHRVRPQLQLPPGKQSAAPIDFDDVWQLDPTATDFVSILGSLEQAKVREASDTYTVDWNGVGEANARGIVKATLVLSRSDLHAIEQTIAVRQGNEVREYKFIEASFERRAPNTVAPAVFEPEAELLGKAVSDTETRGRADTETITASRAAAASPSAATAELEVEALRLLHQAGADLGEQVSVTRTAEGQLRIQGLVESDKRKNELRSALNSIESYPTVRIEIQTVAEAAAAASRKIHRRHLVRASRQSRLPTMSFPLTPFCAQGFRIRKLGPLPSGQRRAPTMLCVMPGRSKDF